MPYSPAAVANSLLYTTESDGETLDPMKLQKLVYFSHGWHLAYERGALSAEHAQAWRWGPVFPTLYNAVKMWGSEPIMKPVEAWGVVYDERKWDTPSIPSDDVSATKLIKRVWEVYGRMSGWALSQLTHEEGGPWHTVYSKNPDARDVVIPDDLIRDYFASKLKANKANART